MARQYKRTFDVYPAYCYKQEIEELNKKSEHGWQLIKGGAFFHKYKKNSDIRYCYQIDYSGRIEDLGRYIETFREQGWEYINSTFNGWSYFRKLWDPNLSEEQYEIFTDKSSLREMTRRWIRVAAVGAVIEAILAVIWGLLLIFMPTLPTLIRFAIFLIFTLILVRGIWLMKKGEQKSSLHLEKVICIALPVLVAVLASLPTYLDFIRPNFLGTQDADSVNAIPEGLDNAVEWYNFDIPYGDNYYVSLAVEADSPMRFSIVNDSGEVVYTVTEASMSITDKKLHLDKGNYQVYISDYEGGKLKLSLGIK